MDLINWTQMLVALIYCVMGALIFIVVFGIVDWISPKDLWGEIADKQNVAMAILAGFVALGLCIIIAAAIVDFSVTIPKLS